MTPKARRPRSDRQSRDGQATLEFAADQPPSTSPGLSDEQRQALETSAVSIALSAGAGCGKTFVLTRRFLANFEPGAAGSLAPEDIGRLVAITFTNAAAREMRDRVRRACYDRLQRSAGAETAYWSRLVRNLDAARIMTIDAFCSSLLRAHAVEAALDPQFALLEPAQADSLIVESTDELLRERLAGRDETALDLAVLFGLESLRRKLWQLAGGHHRQELVAWQAATPEQLVARWAEAHRQEVVPCVMRRISRHQAGAALVAFLESRQPTDAIVVEQRQAILEIMAAWRAGRVLAASAADDLTRLRDNAKTKRRTPKAWPAAEDYDRFRDLCEPFRAQAIDKLSPQLRFDPQAALPTAKIGLDMLRLAIGVAERYEEAKRAAAALDFHDLLSRAHALLAAPENAALRKRLGDQIRLLLVDEFQDTDPLQVALIRALCGEGLERGKLFFVGDYKQSIYRFRGADPRVFRGLRESLPAAGRLPLTLNFRSQPAILNFVNALFATALGPEYEPLRAHRSQRTPTPAVEFLWALPEGDGARASDGEGAGADRAGAPKESADEIRRREAQWVARRLRGMIDSAAPLVAEAAAGSSGEDPRPVRYGDIAILFRALSDVAHYEEALRAYGLPYYLVGGHAFYAQQEIFDLTNLLRAVQDPADVVSLAGALRSPFFSLTDESLFWLAQHPDGLNAGLVAARLADETTAAEMPVEERRRARFAADVLGELRAAKDRVSIAALINLALERTGYDALLLAEFLGERKLANLQKLIDLARGFERDGLFKLSDFIGELAGQVAEQPKEALAATHGAGMDVVRLMSVHQSKGLEFPVVVVVDLDRPANSRHSGVEFSRELGPLVKIPDDGEQPAAVGGYELFQLLAGEEDEAEVNRLFYVAATRAADYLILSSGLSRLDRPQGPWLELLASRFDLATGALRETTPEGDGSRIKVTQSRPSCSVPEGGRKSVDWPKVLSEANAQAVSHSSIEGLRAAAGLSSSAESAPRQETLLDKPAVAPGGAPSLQPSASSLKPQASASAADLRGVAPVPVATSERRLFSFSRLSGALKALAQTAPPQGAGLQSDDEPSWMPETGAADPIGLGTLVHAALADLRFPATPDEARELVDWHSQRHVEPHSPDIGLAKQLVERFIASPRAAALAAANMDLSETEFLFAWPSGEPSAGGRQFWGFIDRLYQDAAGEWTILDFKTNQAPPGSRDRIGRQYELQMLAYAAAAERALGKPPTSLVLHLLRTGEEISFAWNAAQRGRLASLVDSAIESMTAR